MSDLDPEHTDPGTNELLEVAYRFGRAVMSLATSAEPRRRRLAEAWHQLSRVEGALSGLWPEPHVPVELVEQIGELLELVPANGSIEETIARLDDPTIARTCQQITGLAFALHQTVGGTAPEPH